MNTYQNEAQHSPSRYVVINGVQLSNEQVIALEQMYRVTIQDGAYWYDHFCGAWGVQGGPVMGVIQPGLNIGGPLRHDASNGNTGVFINGRQLHLMDVLGLQQLGPVLPGRYWVDAQGNVGFEGGPAFANLWVMARTYGGNRGGAWTVNSSTGTVGGDNSGFLFFQGNDGTSWSN